jgi:hypothetical protein
VPMPPVANPLVTGLATAAPAVAAGTFTTTSIATTSPSRLITFTGFLGVTINSPGGQAYRILYRDLRMENWLLVEDSRIVNWDQVRDETAPNDLCDIIWVTADAVVGRGRGSLSDEARFLTGQFTRAGDFEAPLTGGTLAASTGVFCEASTPLCCTRHSS